MANFMEQIILCREGRCIDLYYAGNLSKEDVERFVQCQKEVKEYGGDYNG